MNLQRDVSWLRELPMFCEFTDEQLQLMAFNCHHRTYVDGEFLFQKDEQAMSAFVIFSGNVDLVDSGGRQASRDGLLGPGAVIGDVAMIVRSHRLTSACAVGAVEAMEIPRSVFHRLLEEFPEIAERIRHAMAVKIGAFVTDLKAVHAYFGDEKS